MIILVILHVFPSVQKEVFFFFFRFDCKQQKNSKVIYNLEMLVMFMYLSVFLGNGGTHLYSAVSPGELKYLWNRCLTEYLAYDYIIY